MHNTIHRSANSSPGKNNSDIPLWKEALLEGKFERDIFTSAANGLEDMFKPPTPIPTGASLSQSRRVAGDQTSPDDSILPSSPPEHDQEYSNYEVYGDHSSEDGWPQRTQPAQTKGRQMKFKLNDDDSADNSHNSDMSSPPDSPGESVVVARSSQLSPFSKPLGVPDHGARKFSNQSAAPYEDFSPILIARQSSEDGKIGFAPVGWSASELQQRLEKLQDDQISSSGSEVSGSRVDAKPYNREATEDWRQLGSFVNVRRGGRSADDSFQRILTPGLGIGNTSDILPEDSLQASTPKQFPSIRLHQPSDTNSRPQTPPVPAAPFPSPTKKAFEAPSNEASPLKLFGPYDTFTNQTLLRRISQFEDPNSSPSSERPSAEHKASMGVLRHMVNPADRHPSDSQGAAQSAADPRQKSTRSVSQFGAGELDGFSFNQDFTRLSTESGDESIVHHSVSFINAPRFSPPQEADNLVIGKRRQKTDSTTSTRMRTLSRDSDDRGVSFIATPTQQDLAAEYKRHLTSPSKNPTPKRRRTLHQSDIAFGTEKHLLLGPAQDHQQSPLAPGKKRKDARAGDTQQTASANVLTSRQMLRPRIPSTNQKPPVPRDVRVQPESRWLQEELAKLSQIPPSGVQHPTFSANGDRKRSIRTEDFHDAARQIMEAIRRKNGLQSGLTSLEESDEDNNRKSDDDTADDASLEESTRERFSRPPSREGNPIARAAKRQEDPELVDHLKKYEEHSDMDDIIASSLRSLGVSKEDIRAVQALEQNSHSSRSGRSEMEILEDSEIVSDPPNIRMYENRHRYENSTAAEQAERFRDQFPSNGSGTDSGFSSVRTGSSRGSDTRRTIAPESVSHLIPDKVGSMVLDKQRNVWVKATRLPEPRTKRGQPWISENSEDDVFADIPDLTVDVIKESQNVGYIVPASSETEKPTRPRTKPADQGGTLRSILVKEKTDSARSPSRLIRQFKEADDEDVEHEITLPENRLDDSSPKRRAQQVNFSSPVSIVIQDAPAGGSSEEQEASVAEPVVLTLPKASKSSTERHARSTASIRSINGQNVERPRNSSSARSRRNLVKGEHFVPRPVSVIEEQDEDSQAGKANGSMRLKIPGPRPLSKRSPPKSGSRQTSLNIVVSTPARPKAQPRPENAEVLSQYVGNLSLSPLSDFTAHQERSYALEVSYVLGDENLVTGDGSQKHMSQAVRHLVDKIAEAEAFEPFWEDMKELELQEKNLDSLHMLDQFCGGLVRLDVSQNAIRALDGIPCTVRELAIPRNLLSGLTAWDRLTNLQYIDVSHNEIKSLSALRSLVHLRDLVADSTGLVSLDGIKYHESLVTLRARDNAIEEVDFEGTSLQRLETLDLGYNRIRKAENLHEVSSLSHLILQGNQLVEFAPEETMLLKHLVISDNKLRSLNLTRMPHLHLVNADRNRLTTVVGLDRAPHLDSLSLREQGGSKSFDMRMLASAYEVRKLFLSGNRLGTFAPLRDFLNLQHLDLANSGLQHLPDNLGDMLPNLRILNLNFNGLSDISSLVGIPRLKRLHIAGNRFTDVKRLLHVLAEFPWLTEVDLRDTTLTQGFYPTVHVVVQQERDETRPINEPFKLPDADPARDAKFRSLLDMETRITRRVYERKMVRACKQLQRLDGLPVNKRIRHVKDIVWKTMVERGLLLRPDGSFFDLTQVTLEDDEASSFMIDAACSTGTQGQGNGREHDESTRWGAEDSFA